MWTIKLTVDTVIHITQDKELKLNDQWTEKIPIVNQLPRST